MKLFYPFVFHQRIIEPVQGCFFHKFQKRYFYTVYTAYFHTCNGRQDKKAKLKNPSLECVFFLNVGRNSTISIV